MPKQITLWMEGLSVMECSAGAEYCGTYEAETLKDAVKQWVDEKPERKGLTDFNRLTYWGCRFFDNESAARASFG